MIEKKRKENQGEQQDRLDAIEIKIENARRRLLEKKKIRSENARNTIKRRTAPTQNLPHHKSIQNKNNYMNEMYDEYNIDI